MLVSRGDDLVLDPAAIGSDVEDFEAALDEGRTADATALYTGPFLHGVHMGGSASLDHWIDERQDHYARRFRAALEALATELEAAGDLTGAVDAWNRLAVQDRFDSRIALRLLLAMDAAGNRPGALRFARVHEQLVQQEFGTRPDPDFLEAVARLKEAGSEPRPATTTPGPATEPATEPAPEPATEPTTTSATDPTGTGVPVGGPVGGPVGEAATRGSAALADLVPRRPGGREGGTSSILRHAVVIALVLVAAGMGGFLVIWYGDQRAPAPDRGLVVLPFSAPDSTDAAFADGLSEEIMDVLGSAGGLRVPARSTAFMLRGLDAKEAAARVGVSHVVEGTVRRDNDRLRISVYLSGADGFRIWSETYDRVGGALFDTWDEIALAVLNALEIQLGRRGLPAWIGGTDDIVAYELYLRGRHSWFKRTPEGFRQALLYFGQAIDRDPRYARAYTGIADAYHTLGSFDYGVLPPDSAYPHARRAAERALALEPDLAEAHAALAQVLFAYDRDYEAADRAYRRAIELNPRYAEAHHWYGLLLIADGKPDSARAAARRAVDIDPLSPAIRTGLARQLHFQGDYDEALHHYNAALATDPSFPTALLGAGLTLLELQRHDEAIAAFRRTLEILDRPHPTTLALLGYALGRAGRHDDARDILRVLDDLADNGTFIAHEYRGVVNLGLDRHETAIRHFEDAADARSSSVAFFAIDPMTIPLRENPAFRALVARLGG